MSKGLLLWSHGDQYDQEAQRALKRIAEVWPDIPVAYDQRPIKGAPLLTRIEVMRETPFDRTLFLDADTWLVQPVPEMLDLLDKFDLACSLAVVREVYPVDVPAAFPELSPGVLAFRSTRKVRDFMVVWGQNFWRDYQARGGISHEQVGFFHSQPSFRETLYHSDLRFAVTPDEYNWAGTGYVQSKVKIIHKRPNPEEEAELLNEHPNRPRTKLLYEQVQVW